MHAVLLRRLLFLVNVWNVCYGLGINVCCQSTVCCLWKMSRAGITVSSLIHIVFLWKRMCVFVCVCVVCLFIYSSMRINELDLAFPWIKGQKLQWFKVLLSPRRWHLGSNSSTFRKMQLNLSVISKNLYYLQTISSLDIVLQLFFHIHQCFWLPCTSSQPLHQQQLLRDASFFKDISKMPASILFI